VIKGLADHGTDVVGESWEISVEPDFPSQLADGSGSLADLIRAEPEAWLDADADAGSIGLLVKLLDAAEPLSVQIHPSDDDARLGPAESGKPESWYIVDRAPGAGLYLGLRPGVTEERMRRAIEEGSDVSELLFFVPVEPGDCFSIAPGTAHAVGPGITLVEPQRVLPGRRGLTYRYWDWNRRYDENGQADESGSPRELHLEEALAVTCWDAPRGEALLAEIRTRAPSADISGPRFERLLGPDAPIRTDALHVSRLSGSGRLGLPDAKHIRGVTVVRGSVRFLNSDLIVKQGRSAALPACLRGAELELAGAEAIVSAAPLSTRGA